MPVTRRDDKYSSGVGLVFLFNLIVGTGALALPGALQKAGWVIGVVLLLVLALFSFITVTFIVESLAIANAVSRKRYGDAGTADGDTQTLLQKTTADFDVFEITEKYEIGQMGVLMTPKWCQVIIYLSLCLYLFGDLAIYAVVFGKTWARIICPATDTPVPNNGTVDDTTAYLCWKGYAWTALDIYRLSIGAFIILIGPFTFFNMQKTKFLQIITAAMRLVAFTIMLIWSTYNLLTLGKQGNPAVADLEALPALFGALVYSFMCQHSIPGLIQPIRNKQHIRHLVPADFSVITIFYLLLCLTAIFSFESLNDLYTLNFWDEASEPGASTISKILAYYLALFPIFTVGTNYPILAITLKNNFRAMVLKDSPPRWYFDQFLFPLAIMLPPTALALAVSDLHLLVGVIGSYCGTCVQYLIPCLLVTFARYHAQTFEASNYFASPFKNKRWVYAVYVWMLISIVIITLNYARCLV